MNNIEIQLKLNRGDFSLDVDMTLPERGISVLFGPSGSGKTTVLRCVAGLETEATGVVRLGDQHWLSSELNFDLPTHERSLGYVFQEASLFEHLNVRQNIDFGMSRTEGAVSHKISDDAVSLLGISHLLSRSVGSLSGGERQRVAIARALATQPQVLLLDEPLAALDQSRKKDVFPWLERLRDELHIPMIYVTHSVDELTRLGDHLVVMDQGKIKASGPVAKTLYALDSAVTDGHEMGVLIEGQVETKDLQWHLAKVNFSGGHLWIRDDGLKLGEKVRLRVLAKDVSLMTEEPRNTSIQNHLLVEISDVVSDAHKSQLLVRMRLGNGYLVARITHRAWHSLNLKVNQQVWAQAKSVAVVH